MISREDALLLLNKWNQESSKLRCIITRPGLQVILVGTITRITEGEAFGLQTADKESWIILFFEHLTFMDYGDHRIASPDPVIQEVAQEYEGFLSILTSDGQSVLLGEIKQQH